MSNRTKILLAVCVALIAITARLLPGPRTIDDAYITFRYARNLLQGNGPVFNPGQAVLGTTTPLYMGVLALLALPIGGAAAPFPDIAWILNALADALTCLLLIRIGYRLRSPGAGWAAAALWAVSPMSVTFAVGGLETSLFILLLVSVLYFRLQGNLIAVSVLSGLAFLTRPDALILLGLVWGELVFSNLRRPGPGRFSTPHFRSC
jgi:arabinofuranosyltransferase